MRSVHAITWNVLHRVHAMNWQETPVTAFPDERERIAGVTATVTRWLSDGVTLVALQEVSGDQLASLVRAIGDRARIFDHVQPRVPTLRVEAPPQLDDATEHLVLIVQGAAPRMVAARTFDSDPGKGLLAIDDGEGLTAIATHVSSGKRGPAQLAELAALVRQAKGAAVVLGDFNVDRDTVAAAFGDAAEVSAPEGQRPTRIATHDRGPRTIDHVVVSRGRVVSVEVLDGRLLSDHNPVSAVLSLSG